MFPKRQRGMLDGAVAALLLWAAAYHTPVGAGALHLAGWALGSRVSGRPLLAYYSGGVYAAQELLPALLPVAATLDPADALGLGVYATWLSLSEERKEKGRVLARRYGLDPKGLEPANSGPAQLTLLLRSVGSDLSSTDAAVLAFFLGYEPTLYAADRVRAEGHGISLEELVRQLPPGYAETTASASRALTLGTAYGLGWPVPDGTPISSGFGLRLHPVLGVRKMHTGVDLPVSVGTLVHAAGAGNVRRASEDAVNGKVLVIDHGHGVSTAYCHNSSLVVGVGRMVARGEGIALSGNSGRSTGPHLHYQLQLADQPVDPFLFHRGTARSEPSRLTKMFTE